PGTHAPTPPAYGAGSVQPVRSPLGYRSMPLPGRGVAAAHGREKALAPTIPDSDTHGPPGAATRCACPLPWHERWSTYGASTRPGPGLSDHDAVAADLHLPTPHAILADRPGEHAAAAETAAVLAS
ncbi:hypothetical protein, partial [Streptomyces sp. URMC 129]|uniref:hypothetical protein n=1 Tax=Streptomyces sp. URMC 129 TaxID=3423407 RepID=UPI003F1D98F0